MNEELTFELQDLDYKLNSLKSLVKQQPIDGELGLGLIKEILYAISLVLDLICSVLPDSTGMWKKIICQISNFLDIVVTHMPVPMDLNK